MTFRLLYELAREVASSAEHLPGEPGEFGLGLRDGWDGAGSNAGAVAR